MARFRVEVEGQRRPGPGVSTVLDQIAQGAAVALCEAIRERVTRRGDLAGQRPPPPSNSPVSVPPVYADGVAGEITESGLERHESRARWQARAGVIPGSYDVSGGMWRGLEPRPVRARESVIRFEGSSLGQVADVVEGVAVPRMVPNATKARTVLEAHGVNPLALSEQELSAIERGVVQALGAAMATHLPVTWRVAPTSATGGVVEVFRAALRGR